MDRYSRNIREGFLEMGIIHMGESMEFEYVHLSARRRRESDYFSTGSVIDEEVQDSGINEVIIDSDVESEAENQNRNGNGNVYSTAIVHQSMIMVKMNNNRGRRIHDMIHNRECDCEIDLPVAPKVQLAISEQPRNVATENAQSNHVACDWEDVQETVVRRNVHPEKDKSSWRSVYCWCPFLCPAGCDIKVPSGCCPAESRESQAEA